MMFTYGKASSYITSASIKYHIFSHFLKKNWAKLICFNGHAINLSIFTWMAFLGGLKTFDIFQGREIYDTFSLSLLSKWP